MTPAHARAAARRSDGERTHAAIVDTAVKLASIEGIGGLTLGRLAQEVGVSKSGLYAHFGSKHGLELEVVDAARAIFEREVIDPALAAPEGRARLERLCESYISYIERKVFPGGCFLAGMLAEFDARTGTMHEEVQANQREWAGFVESLVRDARDRGELRADADAAQLAFEITAVLDHANFFFTLFDDPAMIVRARHAIGSAIGRVAC